MSTCGCGAAFHLECRAQLGGGRCSSPGCEPDPATCVHCGLGDARRLCDGCGARYHVSCRIGLAAGACTSRGCAERVGADTAAPLERIATAPAPTATSRSPTSSPASRPRADDPPIPPVYGAAIGFALGFMSLLGADHLGQVQRSLWLGLLGAVTGAVAAALANRARRRHARD